MPQPLSTPPSASIALITVATSAAPRCAPMDGSGACWAGFARDLPALARACCGAGFGLRCAFAGFCLRCAFAGLCDLGGFAFAAAFVGLDLDFAGFDPVELDLDFAAFDLLVPFAITRS